jgi:hypothetical protein
LRRLLLSQVRIRIQILRLSLSLMNLSLTRIQSYHSILIRKKSHCLSLMSLSLMNLSLIRIQSYHSILTRKKSHCLSLMSPTILKNLTSQNFLKNPETQSPTIPCPHHQYSQADSDLYSYSGPQP